jgi:Siphovirus Gp157
MTTPLLRHLAEYEYLREQLQAEYREADEDTLRDTLEGISSLPEALATVVRSYLDDLTFAAALGIRISEMQDRLSRIEQRAEKKRGVITAVMERADIRKLVEPDFTASLRAVPPSLLVMDEREVPAAFWRPQAPKLDRRALIAALGAGQLVPGAALGNGTMTLSVRSK